MPSRHCVIQADQITLPRSGGDRDIDVDFDAPGIPILGMGTEWQQPRNRPYLLYRTNVQGDDPVHLVLKINQEVIVDQTLRDTSARSFHQVFGHGILRSSGNTLAIRVPNDQPGTLIISDILVAYTDPDDLDWP